MLGWAGGLAIVLVHQHIGRLAEVIDVGRKGARDGAARLTRALAAVCDGG